MTHSQIRTQPLRWLAKATALGAVLGYGIYVARVARVAGGLGSIEVGVIFSLVMWGGFDLLGAPMERFPPQWHPARVGAVTVAWILGYYVLLLAVALAVVRLVVGVNLARNGAMLTTCVLIGLAVSGFMATQDTVTRKVEVERRLAKAEARASFLSLQAQLQPHTLFNALNTIASLIHEDPAKAEEATERLAGLLRRVLGALERPEWPLREEFQLLDHLLRLEELRFGDRLHFRLELEPAMEELPVQPLLLLPLVENALKHGFRPKVGACHLVVKAVNGTVRIQDDGVGRAPESPDGLGLRTVRERLGAAGGSLSWVEAGSGCTVEVRL
jgi:two-component sensor histidine kinase